jgi:hypothetical protein
MGKWNAQSLVLYLIEKLRDWSANSAFGSSFGEPLVDPDLVLSVVRVGKVTAHLLVVPGCSKNGKCRTPG